MAKLAPVVTLVRTSEDGDAVLKHHGHGHGFAEQSQLPERKIQLA
jgi:hypothetical protein